MQEAAVKRLALASTIQELSRKENGREMLRLGQQFQYRLAASTIFPLTSTSRWLIVQELFVDRPRRNTLSDHATQEAFGVQLGVSNTHQELVLYSDALRLYRPKVLRTLASALAYHNASRDS